MALVNRQVTLQLANHTRVQNLKYLNTVFEYQTIFGYGLGALNCEINQNYCNSKSCGCDVCKIVKIVWCIHILGGEILRKGTTWKTLTDKYIWN